MTRPKITVHYHNKKNLDKKKEPSQQIYTSFTLDLKERRKVHKVSSGSLRSIDLMSSD